MDLQLPDVGEGHVVSNSHDSDQLELALEWGRQPWAGASPRSLTRVARGESCVVDKSDVGCPSREALRSDPDPAQFTMFLKGTQSCFQKL